MEGVQETGVACPSTRVCWPMTARRVPLVVSGLACRVSLPAALRLNPYTHKQYYNFLQVSCGFEVLFLLSR